MTNQARLQYFIERASQDDWAGRRLTHFYSDSFQTEQLLAAIQKLVAVLQYIHVCKYLIR